MNVELARMPLFEGLDAAALEEIHRQMRSRQFSARTFICRQGDPGDSLLLIVALNVTGAGWPLSAGLARAIQPKQMPAAAD